LIVRKAEPIVISLGVLDGARAYTNTINARARMTVNVKKWLLRQREQSVLDDPGKSLKRIGRK
jgi:hypothetical protein